MAINRTSHTTLLDNGQTLAPALARRKMLSKQRALLSHIISMAGRRDYRVTHSEIKMLTTVKVSELQNQLDVLAKQFRELDTKIQGQNWTADI